MTKFKNYINEYAEKPFGISIDEMLVKIDKDCKKYNKLIGNKTPLYRGSRYPGDLGMARVRQDRRTSGGTFFGDAGLEWLNQWLKKNGYPERTKSIITTSDKQHTQIFGSGSMRGGSTFYIFPIGSDWNYAYCHKSDFNYETTLQSALRAISDITLSSTGLKIAKDDADFELTKFISNSNFNLAYKNGWEIWFDCKKFYYISASEYTL